ncbi:IclR family transcriptional regulator [Lentibacillus kapialis]|uniref:IclR family transcriptional regulator n=1 Tax=Lentibacillus kapialis TaxID=340214 RepID=A0A917PY94_9BACI|nr:IclR family transcriptional regulator C-terminal domain-containing protein [Lentibacillus kapialis]GGJ99189.1 IclR family transcriptional regulator [Lentibacillus kapialis]
MKQNRNLVSKVITILRAFADVKMEWGVNELSRYIGIPAGSLHRHLSILMDENILNVSHESGKYTIGEEFIRISSIISSRVKIKDVAKPFLETLAQTVDQSVYLALYHPQYKQLSFVESVQSSKALQYILEIGVLKPIHIAASGKSILAQLENSEKELILHNIGMDKESAMKLDEELSMIRNEGYALTANERKKGALSVGVPIFGVSHKVIGSVITVIPIVSYEESQKDFIVEQTKKAANDISYAIGFEKRIF